MPCSILLTTTRYHLYKKKTFYYFSSLSFKFQVSHFICNLYMRIHCWETIPNSLAKTQKVNTHKFVRFSFLVHFVHELFPFAVFEWLPVHYTCLVDICIIFHVANMSEMRASRTDNKDERFKFLLDKRFTWLPFTILNLEWKKKNEIK